MATTTTTETPIELMSLSYSINPIVQDGLEAMVEADRLEVFLDDEPNRTWPLEEDQRAVIVTLDITDLAPGLHLVRFDLFDADEIVSTETIHVSI